MKRLIIVLAVLAVIGIASYLGIRAVRARGEQDLIQYKVTKVETSTVKKTVSASGVLQPWTMVDIKSKAGGRVDALLVDVGGTVSKGQVLAKIDPSDTLLSVNTARADTDSASARVSQSQRTWKLQTIQTELSLATTKSQLESALASQAASKARLTTARNAAATQPNLTRSAIEQAQANLVSAQQQRKQLDSSQVQDRASAKSAHDQAIANQRNAEANLTRQKALFAKGFVAQQAVDAAEASAAVTNAQLDSAAAKLRTIDDQFATATDVAEARVRQAQAQLDSAKTQSVDIENRKQALTEAEAAFRQSEAAVAQARTALAQANANRANNDIRRLDISTASASVERAKATMLNATNTLDQTTVRSPADGVILKKYVEQGTIISSALSFAATGNNILQLGDTSRMYVDVSVDETDIANVDEGQDVEVTIEAYPGIPFEGKVTRIDPQAILEQNVTTIHVRVEVDNSAASFRLLKPGMNATCEFVKDKRPDVLSLPSDAVRTDDQGRYVELTNDTGKPAPPDPKTAEPAPADTLVGVKIKRQPVEVGLEGNDTTEIVSGVADGQTVVLQTIEPEVATGGGSPFGGGGMRMGGMGRGGR